MSSFHWCITCQYGGTRNNFNFTKIYLISYFESHFLCVLKKGMFLVFTGEALKDVDVPLTNILFRNLLN